METDFQQRLRRIRGSDTAKNHNARTVAALTGNPGCTRRAVLDAAGVDKEKVARHAGFPAKFGQSQFAITRGNGFEAQVKANGFAELIRLLRETLGLEIREVANVDLEDVGGNTAQEVRHTRARQKLTAAAANSEAADTFYDHPLLTLDVGGNQVYLEPDLVAFHHDGVFYVVEIKSFAVIDDQADGGKVAAAAMQSAVYVLALRRLLGEDKVADEIVLVCPKDFSNQPVATKVDVRKQLIVLTHQLARLPRIEGLVEALPPDLTLDLVPGEDGKPTRSPAEITQALGCIDARYGPECLATCEMAFFCRDEARGHTAALGLSVREELGGVETVAAALGLADGSLIAGDDQAEAAAILRATARIFGSATA